MDQNTTFVAISMKVFFVTVKVIVANAQIKSNNVGLNPKHYIMSDTNKKKNITGCFEKNLPYLTV